MSGRKIFSFGGGIQSMAVLVLAAKREIEASTFVFANTGDDSENPDTIDYLKNWAYPFAAKHGIDLVTVAKKGLTLYEHCISDDNRTIAIPMRMGGTGAPGNRKCTSDWKIKPIAKFTRSLGATRTDKATVGIGISVDEIQRAKDSQIDHQSHWFPLLDLRLRRTDCANIIREARLPVPPKSACWFCPYKRLREWQQMATEKPELFEKAAKLEAKLEAKRERLQKDHVYLTDRLVPLKEAVLPSDQLKLPIYEPCEGFCML